VERQGRSSPDYSGHGESKGHEARGTVKWSDSNVHRDGARKVEGSGRVGRHTDEASAKRNAANRLGGSGKRIKDDGKKTGVCEDVVKRLGPGNEGKGSREGAAIGTGERSPERARDRRERMSRETTPRDRSPEKSRSHRVRSPDKSRARQERSPGKSKSRQERSPKKSKSRREKSPRKSRRRRDSSIDKSSDRRRKRARSWSPGDETRRWRERSPEKVQDCRGEEGGKRTRRGGIPSEQLGDEVRGIAKGLDVDMEQTGAAPSGANRAGSVDDSGEPVKRRDVKHPEAATGVLEAKVEHEGSEDAEEAPQDGGSSDTVDDHLADCQAPSPESLGRQRSKRSRSSSPVRGSVASDYADKSALVKDSKGRGTENLARANAGVAQSRSRSPSPSAPRDCGVSPKGRRDEAARMQPSPMRQDVAKASRDESPRSSRSATPASRSGTPPSQRSSSPTVQDSLRGSPTPPPRRPASPRLRRSRSVERPGRRRGASPRSPAAGRRRGRGASPCLRRSRTRSAEPQQRRGASPRSPGRQRSRRGASPRLTRSPPRRRSLDLRKRRRSRSPGRRRGDPVRLRRGVSVERRAGIARRGSSAEWAERLPRGDPGRYSRRLRDTGGSDAERRRR
jgi:hypothetical protein